MVKNPTIDFNLGLGLKELYFTANVNDKRVSHREYLDEVSSLITFPPER